MIILTILKIIGIILGSIVGLALFLVLLVCLAPITYQVEAKGSGKDVNALGKVRWLFGLIRINAAFQDGTFHYMGKALWFQLFSDEEEEEMKEESIETIPSVKIPESIPLKSDSEKTMVKTENVVVQKQDSKTETVVQTKIESRTKGIKENEKENTEQKKTKEIEEKKKEKEKKKQEKEKQKNIKKRNAKAKKERRRKKLEELKEKYEKIQKLVSANTTKRALNYLKILVFRLLNHIKPGSIKGKVEFGLGSPDKTALIYGIGSNLLGAIDRRLVVIPHLEEKMVDVDVRIKGRLFVGFMLILFLRFMRNKDITRVRRYIKRNF